MDLNKSQSDLIPHRSLLTYGDLMRVCGAFGVMITHIAAQGVFKFSVLAPETWWMYNIIESAFRWAMPLFIMLSGALLLDPTKTDTPKVFYAKRMTRIGIPLLFWSGFYILWSSSPLEAFVATIAFGLPYYHLDFMYILVGLYLFVPVFRAITLNVNREHLGGFILLVFIMTVGATLFRKIEGSGLNIFVLPLPYIGYFFAGYYLRNVSLNTKNSLTCIILFVVAIIATALGIGWTFPTGGAGGVGIYFYDYLSPTAVIMTLCVFALIVTASSKPQFANIFSSNISKLLSPYTLGVYLIHPLVLDIIQRYGLRADTLKIWAYIPLTLLVVSAISLSLAYLLSKIPYLKWIVG